MLNQDPHHNNTISVEDKNIINSWEELKIKKDLLRGIYAYGFEIPSIIQRRAIAPILERKDIIAQAQSGTGKTGCFTVAGIELVDTTQNDVQVVILSPTRELSYQIKTVLDKLAVNIKNFRSHLLVGGTSTENDIKILNN
jgi:superfamily II DNA/RNA helicase